MAIQKKSLIGNAAAKSKTGGTSDKKPGAKSVAPAKSETRQQPRLLSFFWLPEVRAE
jgi:hypothetical protein